MKAVQRSSFIKNRFDGRIINWRGLTMVLNAASHIYKRLCPSVRPPVRPPLPFSENHWLLQNWWTIQKHYLCLLGTVLTRKTSIRPSKKKKKNQLYVLTPWKKKIMYATSLSHWTRSSLSHLVIRYCVCFLTIRRFHITTPSGVAEG